MRKVYFFIGLLFTFVSCETQQEVIDGGVSSPYYDGTIMDYLRSNDENWELTVQMIERAGLTDLFEGKVDTVLEITFFAPPSYSIFRYLMDSKYKNVSDEKYETVADVPKDLCRSLILKHVVVGKFLKDDIGFRNMDYNIFAVEQDGGSRFTCMDGNRVIAYLEKTPYKGVPDVGPIEMNLYSFTRGVMIPLATPNIQPKNGVVHALNYGYDFGKI